MIEQRLEELAIILPEAPKPVANYVPYVIADKQVIISGQIAKIGDKFITGKVGQELSIEQGQEAAYICALNILAQLKEACQGDLNKVQKCLKLGIFVNSAADFTNQADIANGASDLMVKIFAENGKHARAAISAAALPLDSAVEIEATFLIA